MPSSLTSSRSLAKQLPRRLTNQACACPPEHQVQVHSVAVAAWPIQQRLDAPVQVLVLQANLFYQSALVCKPNCLPTSAQHQQPPSAYPFLGEFERPERFELEHQLDLPAVVDPVKHQWQSPGALCSCTRTDRK